MKKKPTTKIIASQPDVLVIFAAIFSTGLLVAQLLPADIYPALFIAAMGCLLISIPEFCARYRLPFLLLGALFAAAFYGNLRAVPPADYSHFLSLEKSTGTLTGRFKGEYSTLKKGGISFKITDSIYDVDEQTVVIPGVVQCRLTRPEFTPEPEQYYTMTGRFSAPAPGRPPLFSADSFDSRPDNVSLQTLAGKVQRRIRDGLNTVLPRRHAAIVIGLILGDTGQISLEDRKLFKETGVSHLLAVSGQHIMVIIMMLAAILHWLKVPPVSRSIAIMLFLVFYAMTTVGSPSIWRALIMYMCVATVLHIESFPSPVRPVALAGLLLLLYDPALISNAAFQLSFTAVLSIIFLRAPIEHYLLKFYLPETLARYLAITFAANLGTMPMTALLFGTVSTSAWLVNPLLIWTFSYILPVAFGTAIMSSFWPAGAIFIAPGLSLVLDGMISTLTFASNIPGQFFFVGNIPGLLIALVYAAMLFLIALFNQRQLDSVASATVPQAPAPLADAKISIPAEIKRPRNTAVSSSETRPENPVAMATREIRQGNPFRHGPTIRAMDEMLMDCRRRPLKNIHQSGTPLIPLQMLSIDSQNLYHQLIDLDRTTFANEPERLLQAHIFLMALTGNEILNRISSHLSPPPAPGEIRIEHVVKDRFLATAILTDSVLHSSLLTRSTSEDFMMIISRAQTVFIRARNQLERIINSTDFAESIEQHLALRVDMLNWCSGFIEFDNEQRRKNEAKLRPEQ